MNGTVTNARCQQRGYLGSIVNGGPGIVLPEQRHRASGRVGAALEFPL